MNRFKFRVFGNPIAQGRPRFFRRGNRVGAYDPKLSRNWKETVKWQATVSGAWRMEGALSMSLQFFLHRPKSLPKKVLHHIQKPDLDNLIKGVSDALNGICYQDDSQIVKLVASKEYGEPTGVIISILEV